MADANRVTDASTNTSNGRGSGMMTDQVQATSQIMSDSNGVAPHDMSPVSPRQSFSEGTPHSQWNANYIPPPASPSRSRDQRPSSSSAIAAGFKSPQELLRRLSLTAQLPSDKNINEADPRETYKDLQLSGNVISATFCIPKKISYRSDGYWELSPRTGTSALFDSFSYLASPKSPWKHTLVGWTGEIEQLPDAGSEGYLRDGRPAPPPLNKASAPIPVNKNVKVPVPGEITEITIPREHRQALEKELERDHGGRVEPVWLSDQRLDDDTIIVRNQQKWRRYGEHEIFTLFHYKQNEPNDGRTTKKSWENYVAMNHAFADAIMAIYHPGDVVLIHDYHLLLLPSILRKRIHTMYIGSFLHIPFPSYEYYRCLTRRTEILKGMLGANMIGFQTYGYSRDFAACCKLILDADAQDTSVDWEGVHASIDVLPIGINANTTLQSAFGSPEVEKAVEALREKYDGMKIIVGRDRLDSIRGLVQKLQAFEVFLGRYPQWHGKVLLVQVTSPTSIEDRDDKNDKTEAKIADLISRINGKYGNLSYAPIEHHPQYLTKESYFALLRIADVGLITSVRDGMNTTALEYILCQYQKHGPLIISEFSGTAGSLSEAYHINPWDLKEVAKSIDSALKMPENVKREAHARLYRYVKEHSIQTWTENYLTHLLTNLSISDEHKTTPVLDTKMLLKQYRASSRRLFMFDYDGTLTPIVNNPDAAIPSDRVIRTLKTLAADPNNAVWIISGRDQKFLDEWMGHISALGLSAEHGSFMRMPYSTEWEDLTKTYDMSWQQPVGQMFDDYTNRTMGSFVERKKIAVTWHYRKSDPIQGPIHAKKCKRELEKLVAGKWDVEVMTGKANLEVRPRFVNKGEIAKRLVEAYGEGTDKEPDFVLCLGDDFTDEDMFRSLRKANLNENHVFATTVGPSNKQTLARWHLTTPELVVSAIAALVKPAEAGDLDDETTD